LLIWKLYLTSCQFTLEADSDEINLADVTEAAVFSSFTPKPDSQKLELKLPKQPEPSMYAEADSDDDSDFE
jgi:hypothetical protein